MIQLRHGVGFCLLVLISWAMPARATDQPTAALSGYFPRSEEQGGWRSLLPADGEPDDSQKARIRELGGVDWDSLKAAWDHNAAAPGATGLPVIRHGHIVGEWYKEGDRTTAFNIYSSSKSYTSTAYGLILSDFGNGPLPNGKTLTLDTKVCNTEWLPESLPLPDPRKAEITVRNLLNMASGLDTRTRRRRITRSNGRSATWPVRRWLPSRTTPGRRFITATPVLPTWCLCSNVRWGKTSFRS